MFNTKIYQLHLSQVRPQLRSLRSIQYRTRHKPNICIKILLHDFGQTVVFMQHWLCIYCSSIDVAIALLYILYSYFRCIVHDSSPELTLPDLWIQKNSHKMCIVAYNQLHSTGPGNIYIYIYIIQFVCLFVRDSRLNYAKNSHQSLRDYTNPPGRTPPRIGVTRHVVSMAFPVYFQYSLCGWPPYFNYRFVGFLVSTRVLLHQRRLKKTNQYVYTSKKTKLERHD